MTDIMIPVPLTIISIIQIVIALGLFNVWLVRFKKPTAYRGGSARTLAQEFKTYGLPSWSVYVIGFLKISIACIMLTTAIIYLATSQNLFPNVFIITFYTAILLFFLMVGAVLMHIKVRDPFIKMVPALMMILLTVILLTLIL